MQPNTPAFERWVRWSPQAIKRRDIKLIVCRVTAMVEASVHRWFQRADDACSVSIALGCLGFSYSGGSLSLRTTCMGRNR
ncbi:hypothetical protein Mal33_39060 [Rosistilla oblonga]|uniref:Uncharacterized protein n=1 Tax=Rosistilla oblonga TaxID=2527990 RepID=A0A518IXT2_9BACT|nr:hypothetical protein Mal33_39060 [Rosistilla oblonga]